MHDVGCPSPRKDGSPCQGRPNKSGFCYSHDPALEEKRQRARVKGGRNKARTARARKLLMDEFENWDRLIDQAADQTYQGTMAPNVATAIASLAGAKVRLFETSLKLWESTEGREELAELRGMLEELQQSRDTKRNGHQVGGSHGI
jgi:hypothetical protein